MSMEMKLARLENRVARMEKQAMLKKIKQAIVKVVRELSPPILEALAKAIYGANTREIEFEMRHMIENRYYQNFIKRAPRRGAIKELWSFFSIYLKKLAVRGVVSLKYLLPLALILTIQVKFSILGIGAALLREAALAYAAYVILRSISRGMEWYYGTDKRDYYAREIAKQQHTKRP